MVTGPGTPHVRLVISERSEIILLKKSLKRLGKRIGLSQYQLGKLDIVVSEITTNLLKYATTPGEILFKEIRQHTVPGIEIISIDRGPGMQNAAHLMQDGVSTTGSMGTGLGAIQRLSDQFDLYSRPNWGTLLLARVFSAPPPPPADAEVAFATLLVPYPGEKVCGDGVAYQNSHGRHTFLLTDGLGHGPHAHEASQQAARVFHSTSVTQPIESFIKTIHRGLTHTRGAAGMVVSFREDHPTVDYCGIGNISLRKVSSQETKRGISAYGILGQNIRNCLSNTRFTRHDGWLVLHSDGIRERWSLTDYPDLTQHDLALVGAAIYKDYRQEKDDCAILTVRIRNQ